MAAPLQLDGLNDAILSTHGGIHAPKTRRAGYVWVFALVAGVAAGAYLDSRHGVVTQAYLLAASSVSELIGSTKTEAIPQSVSRIKPFAVVAGNAGVSGHRPQVGEDAVARDQVLARLDQLEGAAIPDRASAPLELDRLQAAISKPVARQAPVVPPQDIDKPERVEREKPMVVARVVPAPKKPVAASSQKEGKPKIVEPSRVAVIETLKARPEPEQASIMLFRKREVAPVLEQRATARPVQPVAQVLSPAQAEREVVEQVAAAQPVIRAPVLIVEETGVRIIGAEGERFIPIGGKLNGKHILATSPKIGLIVTEDSAIRVNNQEQK